RSRGALQPLQEVEPPALPALEVAERGRGGDEQARQQSHGPELEQAATPQPPPRAHAPRGARPLPPRALGERQDALQLALHQRVLVAADGARLLDHLLLDVLVELLQTDDPIAVEVA